MYRETDIIKALQAKSMTYAELHEALGEPVYSALDVTIGRLREEGIIGDPWGTGSLRVTY